MRSEKKANPNEVTITELLRHAGDVIARAHLNGPVTITYRGKPRAVMVPVRERRQDRRSIRDYPAFGIWKDRDDMKDPVAWVRKQRRSRVRRLWQ